MMFKETEMLKRNNILWTASADISHIKSMFVVKIAESHQLGNTFLQVQVVSWLDKDDK
jgi:hypothetical protein